MNIELPLPGFRRYLLVLAVILGVASALFFASGRQVDIVGFRVGLRAVPSLRGFTRLQVPPLGELSARTHSAPVSLELSLRHLDFSAMSHLLEGGRVLDDMLREVEARAVAKMRAYVVGMMLTAGAVSVLSALIFDLRSLQSMALAFSGGVVVIALLAGMTYATYDMGAFDRPRLQGAVAAYPQLLPQVQGGMQRLEELRGQMRSLGEGLMDIYGGPDLPQLAGAGADFTFLVISDVHNNVAGLDFVGGLVDSYPVRAIIDAGDLTDWGTPLEAQIAGQIGEMDVPYIFVAGNHESPEVVATMHKTPNVTVLDGLTTAAGVKILGFPDPASERTSPAPATEEEIDALRERYEGALSEMGESGGDLRIVVSHDPRAVRDLTAHPAVDLVIAGHMHRLTVEQEDHQALYVNPGTTGAAGLRGLQHKSGATVPYTAVLLHFSAGEKRVQLTGIDSVTIDLQKGNISVQREVSIPRRDESPRE